MKLNEWIENKSKELVNNKTFKSVVFRRIYECKLSATMMSTILDFKPPNIDMDVEVEEVNRKELQTAIDVLEVDFDVVKPRCRKHERFSLYVRVA